MPEIDFHPAITIAIENFALNGQDSIHGLGHWGRVLENGMRLAPLTGADPLVVALFAIFHDCKRESDGGDLQHGPRAALFVRDLTSDLALSAEQRDLLIKACAGHTSRLHSTDPTIGTCWDADRFDMPRIGDEDYRVLIDSYFLSTAAAQDPDIREWAQIRAEQAQVPTFVIPYL